MRHLIPVAVLGLLLPTTQGQAGDDVAPAKRIWAAQTKDQQEVWFRRTLDLPKNATSAQVSFSCDNGCTVFVNGQAVGACDDHQDLTVVDLGAQPEGKVTLAVHAKNSGGPAALVLWFTWSSAEGSHHVVTDAQWRVSEAEVEGWQSATFDDSRWALASANFESAFGRCTYGGTPKLVHKSNAYTLALAPIEKAVATLRTVHDREGALKALDDLERAVARARAQVWGAPHPAKGR